MNWLRLYHETITDSKWPAIARRAQTNQGTVVSVWIALLIYASQHEDRGSVEGFCAADYDVQFGYEDGTVERVCDAMEDRGVIRDGRIAAWEKRQPRREREDAESSTKRVQEYRERNRQKANRAIETPCNANETPCNADDSHETPPDKDKEKEKEKDKYIYIQDAVGNKGGMGGEEPNPASGGGSGEQKQLLTDHTPEEQEVLSLFEGVHDLKQPDSGKLVKQYRTLKADFPSVDILSEVKKMALWLENRSKKDNAKANVLLFMRNWVERASKTPSPSMSDLQRYKNGPPQANADGSIGKADEGNEERNRRLAEKYMRQFEGMM